jgi:hypothetical protein
VSYLIPDAKTGDVLSQEVRDIGLFAAAAYLALSADNFFSLDQLIQKQA